MIYACYHEKSQPDTALCFGGEFSQACLIGNACVGTKRIVSVLKQEHLEKYEGSIAVNNVELLSEEVPAIKIIDTEKPLRKEEDSNNYALNAALDKFVNESSARYAVVYRFRTIINMVYADLQTKPFYLFIDLNGSRPEEQRLVVEFIARVFSLGPILINAPAISMNIRGDFIPLSKFLKPEETPAAPSMDIEHIAFDAFVDEIAGIKPAVAGELLKQNAKAEEKPAEAKPEAPSTPEPSPSPEAPAAAPSPEAPAPAQEPKKTNPIIAFFKSLDEKTVDLILNILFAVLFTGLAISVCPINFVFSTEGSNTMFIVCVIVCYVFMIMAQVPIASIYQADKEELNPFKVKPYLFTAIGFSVLGIAAGITLMMVGNSQGWDSGKGIAFYIAYFLYPVFLAAYTGWAVFRKYNPRKK